MSLGMQRSEAHSSKTFRQYMAKWGPEHKEPGHGKGRYFGGSRTEDECSGGPTLALWMAAKHAGVNLIELEKGTSAYASHTRAMLLCTLTHCIASNARLRVVRARCPQWGS